ncbi:iron(III) transport system substrate-binding protein [Caminicella sporogenes DSM 14501]|uniref:Iron(III) transport system substrate-binding protein n=1 Tax=Caminicella sporogenes DSM 14501 TaxID=1121266 RepID=A0A1M6S2I2_9FIRM|nr:extracellular solute-binding protein [Caminicella sporogenes]RKD27171.1 ABC transporter substrate-binding protein [Caminicella sporogenes]SHK38849.1 iron(III) transport system substrate-binding protein [Caminicella sporogenes DSM 14501]
MERRLKSIIIFMLMFLTFLTFVVFVGCTNESKKQVVIYTNADEEAIEVMKNVLDNEGYEGKYILKSFGTSELGGKLMAEGSAIEADLITMSSYFIESAQKQHNMFEQLQFDTGALRKYPSYYTPILANTGSIFVNTQVINEKSLSMPKSIKDLTRKEYRRLVSIPNIMDSSTGWLLIQAIISEYGESEGIEIMKALIQNCGPHIESSGSGPIKKVRVGEVAVGFGLRHQAVADKIEGKPIEVIDPVEGNFTLTESVAVVKKDDKEISKLAMEMAKVIVKKARKELINYYPVALYKGEIVNKINKPANFKVFKEPLTVDLLKVHQNFFKSAVQAVR